MLWCNGLVKPFLIWFCIEIKSNILILRSLGIGVYTLRKYAFP
jgi:hypothetical protein